MQRKFACHNRWSHFFLLSIITALAEVIVCISLFNIKIDENIQLILVMLTLNIASMAFIALNMMAYIHFKSPHYEIRLSDDMIIIPKYEWIPDSYFIHFSDIIYINEYDNSKANVFQIVYNGGSVRLKKSSLRNPNDVKEIVYYLKEEVL